MQTQKFILQKAYSYKFFMLIAFMLFSLVMYQGHIKVSGIYSILFFISLGLCAFQIATILYVTFVKRAFYLFIDDDYISWYFTDNNKKHKEQKLQISKIKTTNSQISYLLGNLYSSFELEFILEDESSIVLTDGLIYDFGLKKAEDICRFLLDNNLGEKNDIKFANLIKEKNINTNETNQIFSKKQQDSYYIGVISDNKKEFLSLRIQIETLYSDYKNTQINKNNEFKVTSNTNKDSFIHLKSNALGLFVHFYKVKPKQELKTLKQLGKRKKIGF